MVPFPFDDLSTTKARPAVCLTDTIGPYQHIILAFITSRIPADLLDTDLILEATRPDFAATGLRVSSTLRLHRLMTVTTSLIQRELGLLTPEMHTEAAIRLPMLGNDPHLSPLVILGVFLLSVGPNVCDEQRGTGKNPTNVGKKLCCHPSARLFCQALCLLNSLAYLFLNP